MQTLQPGLFDSGAPGFDAGFRRLERIQLDPSAWIDFAPDWVSGAGALFERIVASRDWKQRTRRLYDQRVIEPRLTAPWNLASGAPLEPAVLEEMRLALLPWEGVGFGLVWVHFFPGRPGRRWGDG